MNDQVSSLLASCPRGIEILLTASCYRNWDKFWQHEPDGSKA